MQRLAMALPEDFPLHEQGVELVELVERTLLVPSPGHVVRDNSPADLVLRCKAVIQKIRDQQLLTYDDATNFVIALLTWVGCLRLAKSLRVVDSADTAYTDDIRRHGCTRGLRRCGMKTGAMDSVRRYSRARFRSRAEKQRSRRRLGAARLALLGRCQERHGRALGSPEPSPQRPSQDDQPGHSTRTIPARHSSGSRPGCRDGRARDGRTLPC